MVFQGQIYITGKVQTMTKSNPFIKQLNNLNYLKKWADAVVIFTRITMNTSYNIIVSPWRDRSHLGIISR